MSKKIVFLSFLILMVSIVTVNSYGETSQTKCLNDDGDRELDFRFVTGVQEFDESLKQVELSINLDVEDEKTQKPFEVQLRRYPYQGSVIINVTQNSEQSNYGVDNYRTIERRITPISNFMINLWPFETYTIPIFLEFNSDARLCYSYYEDSAGDIHSYKEGYFPENPNWDVSITSKEIQFSELEKIIPGIKPRFENSTIFQFDTIIFHTDGYKAKNVFYFIVALIPILLIIGHGIFIRFEKVGVHITFFAGVTILILTSLFAIRPSTPIDLTILETISLSSIGAYAIGFFIFLYRHKNRYSDKDHSKHKGKITDKELQDINKIMKNSDNDAPFRNRKIVMSLFYILITIAGILTFVTTATTIDNLIVKIVASTFTVVLIGLAFAVLNKGDSMKTRDKIDSIETKLDKILERMDKEPEYK